MNKRSSFNPKKLALLALTVAVLGTSAAYYLVAQPVEVVNAQRIGPSTMEKKLLLAQDLLRHISVKNFDEISKVAGELIELTVKAQWSEDTSSRYDMFAEDFRFRLEKIQDGADSKRIHVVSLNYTNLIRTCVECHEDVRDGEVLARAIETPAPLGLDQLRQTVAPNTGGE